MSKIDDKWCRCSEVGGVTSMVTLRVASESCVFPNTTKTLNQTWMLGYLDRRTQSKVMVVLMRISARKISAKLHS